jgi:hypothetical protein
MKKNIIVTLLVVIGLLITVNAIHAYDEISVENEGAIDVQGAKTAGIVQDTEDVHGEEGVHDEKDATDAINAEATEEKSLNKEEEGIKAIADVILENWKGDICEDCEDFHDEIDNCVNMSSRMNRVQCVICGELLYDVCEQCVVCEELEHDICEKCVTCEEHMGGVCEQCKDKEVVSCEECLACENCQLCEECKKCLDCADCEHCSNREECLKCEGCDPGFVYEDWQLPRIEGGEPDGGNGYYLRVPEIKVSHQLEKIFVHYRFTNGLGETTEGIVSQTDNNYEGYFSQGENTLEVWVELPDRTWSEERIFKLDSINPEEPIIVFDKQMVYDSIYSKDRIKCTFESSDEGSGVYGYFYKIGNHEEVFVEGESGELIIDDEFAGAVAVVAIDSAGNKSEVSTSPPIIIDKNLPIISITSANIPGRWNHSIVAVEVKVEEWGVSSGLESVRISLDNEIILSRSFNQGEKVYVYRDTIQIDKNSQGGLGLNLTIEAMDNVGNTAVVNQSFLIDTKEPAIAITGATDGMIVGSEQTIEIEFEDENLLSYYQVNISHSTFEGDENESILQGEINGVSEKRSVNLEDEGQYIIEATVRDISGRESEATMKVIVDKTSPIIQYVEQLNGKHIPYFQWNYRPEELIHDSLHFQYEMELNRSIYASGTLVDNEGEYVFQVNATDEAGNESSVNASFTIDNTPPKIYFYNVDNEESYENEIMLGIAVSENGERIKKVEVNGEIASIERGSQMVQLRLSQTDEYTVTVEADDLAGNISKEEICFSIIANSDGLAVVDKNVREKAEGQVDRIIEKLGATLPDGVVKAIEGGAITNVLIGACLIFIVAGVVGFILYKKLKKRQSYEEGKCE